MRFWTREIAGWGLVALGLFIFYLCFALLMNTGEVVTADGRVIVSERPRIIEVGPLTFIGFVVFRGGIHLLKVAVAARVCLQAQERLDAGGRRPDAVSGRSPVRTG